MKPNCYLHALSSYVPAEVLTNDDLSKLVETNDEWIKPAGWTSADSTSSPRS